MAETTHFDSGAVRSADVSEYSFTSLPMIGLLALARTAGEGAAKYGRFNYLRGMPIHDLLEHIAVHWTLYNAGDRSEPHLAHLAWGALTALQEEVLNPHAHQQHMLGPGMTIPPDMRAYMDKMKPVLEQNRAKARMEQQQTGKDPFAWTVSELAAVAKLLAQRHEQGVIHAPELAPQPASGPQAAVEGSSAKAEHRVSDPTDKSGGFAAHTFPRREVSETSGHF